MPILNLPGINNELKSPLRFYTTMDLKNKNRKVCRGINPYKLIMGNTRFIPFQFLKSSNSDLDSWRLYDAKTDAVVMDLDIGVLFTHQIATTGTPINPSTEVTYVIYYGDNLNVFLDCGSYYVQIQDVEGSIAYSEDFEVLPNGYSGSIITDGDFINGLDSWVHSSNVTANGDSACFPPTTLLNPTYIRQVGIVEANKKYLLTVRFKSVTNPQVMYFYIGSQLLTIVDYAPGVDYLYQVESSVTGDFQVSGELFTNACIDYVSLEPYADVTDNCHPSLIWKNDCGFVGNLIYINDFEHQIFLDPSVEMVTAEPTFTREIDENGNKDRIIKRIRRDTYYKLQIGLIPQFLLDALSEMVLHKSIYYRLPNNMGMARLYDVDVVPAWDQVGRNCLVTTIVTFRLDESSVQGGCVDCDESPVLCTERSCDPTLTLEEDAITDFTFDDPLAISLGLSIDEAPNMHGNNITEDQKVCSAGELGPDAYIMEFTKTLIKGRAYVLRLKDIATTTGGFFIFYSDTDDPTLQRIGAVYSGKFACSFIANAAEVTITFKAFPAGVFTSVYVVPPPGLDLTTVPGPALMTGANGWTANGNRGQGLPLGAQLKANMTPSGDITLIGTSQDYIDDYAPMQADVIAVNNPGSLAYYFAGSVEVIEPAWNGCFTFDRLTLYTPCILPKDYNEETPSKNWLPNILDDNTDTAPGFIFIGYQGIGDIKWVNQIQNDLLYTIEFDYTHLVRPGSGFDISVGGNFIPDSELLQDPFVTLPTSGTHIVEFDPRLFPSLPALSDLEIYPVVQRDNDAFRLIAVRICGKPF